MALKKEIHLRFEVLKVNASKQTENKNISGEGCGIFHLHVLSRND
jgi:hypothetical protein